MKEAIPLQQPETAVAQDQSPPLRKHSKLGLSSLLIALGLPLVLLALIMILFLLQVGIANEGFTYFVVILGASIIGGFGHLIGVVLGIAAASRKQNKKLLPTLGIIFNSVPMLLAAIVCILFAAFLIHPFPLGPK